MDTVIKISACALIASVVSLLLNKTGKEFSLLISAAVCCLIAVAALSYLDTVFTFLNKISQMGQINGETVRILFKAVGISFLAEFTSLLCSDAGNNAMAKIIQMMATIVIIWLSIPLMNNLLDLVAEILEKA